MNNYLQTRRSQARKKGGRWTTDLWRDHQVCKEKSRTQVRRLGLSQIYLLEPKTDRKTQIGEPKIHADTKSKTTTGKLNRSAHTIGMKTNSKPKGACQCSDRCTL